MNLPDVINVAIGLVVLYLVLSTVVSALIELFARALGYREEILTVTINSLLDGEKDRPWSKWRLLLDRAKRETRERIPMVERILPAAVAPAPRTLSERFWQHPKARSLGINTLDAPTRIEPATFSQILVDLAIPRNAQGDLPQTRVALERRLASDRGAASPALRDSLLTLLRSSDIRANASGDALWTPYYRNIALWYSETMAAASERYKRAVQSWLLYAGFAIAAALNADTIRAAQILSLEPELRERVAALAAEIESAEPSADAAPPASATARADSGAADEPAPEPATVAADDREIAKRGLRQLKSLRQLGYPIGWTGEAGYDFFPVERGWIGWPLKLLGFAITALAISMGASFWHDLLGKLISLSRKARGEAPPLAETSPGKDNPPKPDSPETSAEPIQLEAGRDLAARCSGFDARKAYWLAEASLLAYQTEDQVSRKVVDDWFLPKPQWWEVVSDEVDTQAFGFATDEAIVVAFRGTEPRKIKDILADIRFAPAAFHAEKGLLPDAKVHGGFANAIAGAYPQISAWISARAPAGKQLYIAGHSLGGALAVLLAARLIHEGHPAAKALCVYTFGSPLVGDPAFAEAYDRHLGAQTYRVVHGQDFVSTLPLASQGFRHVGAALRLLKPDGLERDIVSVDRFLDFAIDAVDGAADALKAALADHSMELYVARCLKLTGARVAQ